MKSTVETRDKIQDSSNLSHTFFKIGFLKVHSCRCENLVIHSSLCKK